ncbi:MAG: DUF3883 domain-containing protein [Pyrinomonadaceae bacterium]
MFSKEQAFWNGVMLGRALTVTDSLFFEETINVEEAAERLDIAPNIIRDFRENFDFDKTSNPANIKPLSYFLEIINLPIRRLNEYLLPRITFRDYYDKQFAQLKNRFEKNFEALLFKYLSTQNARRQEMYQNYIDEYKTIILTPFVDAVAMDVSTKFVEHLNEKFGFLGIQVSDIGASLDGFNPNVSYIKELELLVKTLKSRKYYSQEALNDFLLNNRHRSLLYFGQTKLLSSLFATWFKPKAKSSNDGVVETENDRVADTVAEMLKNKDGDIEFVEVSSIASVEKSSRATSTLNGRRYDGAASNSQNNLIGIVAELKVYLKLTANQKDVKWVSKNASKVPPSTPGYNPEGDDSLGYDIEYLDGDGNKVFVEVKGRSDGTEAFEITKKELEEANQKGEYYKVIFVTHVLENSKRRIRDLGNIFLLEKGMDFFSNNRFLVVYKSFEIRFRQLTNIEEQ